MAEPPEPSERGEAPVPATDDIAGGTNDAATLMDAALLPIPQPAALGQEDVVAEPARASSQEPGEVRLDAGFLASSCAGSSPVALVVCRMASHNGSDEGVALIPPMPVRQG